MYGIVSFSYLIIQEFKIFSPTSPLMAGKKKKKTTEKIYLLPAFIKYFDTALLEGMRKKGREHNVLSPVLQFILMGDCNAQSDGWVLRSQSSKALKVCALLDQVSESQWLPLYCWYNVRKGNTAPVHNCSPTIKTVRVKVAYFKTAFFKY
ncbi:tissue factor pathway inhibitor 2 [Platysternon megacephalum]|uniref:Tissue factor pathway inhibitor 2 n=1 Tax=Platysternon megacephalum TaxID=55544 RepID=A0A4D9ECP2_9SAUR|nr:tissue factor pathway inhibitor 2 [Platysternon megacephalum]